MGISAGDGQAVPKRVRRQPNVVLFDARSALFQVCGDDTVAFSRHIIAWQDTLYIEK